MAENYKTIPAFATASFIERKSEFIGYVKPVHTVQEAADFIAEIKQKHRDATHHVPAYILKDGQKRCSDDGEPQGTAGVPVLDVLEKENVVDVCAVVTRYFGGILLGTGGLVRAYSHGCKIALDAAGIVTRTYCLRQRLKMDYPFYGKVSNILPSYDIRIQETAFTDLVDLEYLIRPEQAEPFAKALRELSAGSLIPVTLGEEYADFADPPQK
ncbi:MAG TPA: YigZ family protein [Firmicutes bacterium]|nr:YigZ family protein [Bacillota bacterium]